MFGSEMFGRLLAGLVVVGLAFGVWILLTPEETGDPSTTMVTSSTTSTTDSSTTTTVTTLGTTTTVVEAAGEIATVEEAEALLQQFWFGWFEGIYNQDEERIKEVVANPDQIAAAKDQFGVLDFDSDPRADSIVSDEVEILRSDTDCTALWAKLTVTGFTQVAFEGVHVFRVSDDKWKFVALWDSPNDLWGQDCDTSL